MAAYLFIPKGRGLAPPYQAVVYVPSGMAWDRRDSRMIGRATGQHDYFWEFVAMSGRAVLYPILRGTYERHLVTAQNPTTDQTLVVNDVQDVRRALDYLRSRGDIDTARIAYYGVSQGAFLGPIAAAVEPRFRTAILLLSVCFNDPRFARLPPATPMRFLPYIHMPVLSIAGAQDYVFSDGPACLKHEFSLLGTPARDRKNLLYPGSHGMWGTFGYQARAEILDWLDRYLGPVEARTHGRKPS
jgi:dienelactone hydrolase